jgi:hypothetical protein
MRRAGKFREATKALLEEVDVKIEEKLKELDALQKEKAYLEKKLLES